MDIKKLESIGDGKYRKTDKQGFYQYYKTCGCGEIIEQRSKTCISCFGKNMTVHSKETTLGQQQAQIIASGKHASWKNSNVRNLCKTWNKHLIALNCQRCGYDKHTEMCHIKPLTSFSDDTILAVVNYDLNILMLCPNCHWEFDNYKLSILEIPSRIIKNPNDLEFLSIFKKHEIDINKIIKDSLKERQDEYNVRNMKHDKIQFIVKTKIEWPTPEEVSKLVWEMSTVKLAAKLGVSDKAVEKFCKKHDIVKPPRGYWRKQETGNV